MAAEQSLAVVPVQAEQLPSTTEATPLKSMPAHAVTTSMVKCLLWRGHAMAQVPAQPAGVPRVPSEATVTNPLPTVVTVHPTLSHSAALMAVHLLALQDWPSADSPSCPAVHLQVRSADALHAVASVAPVPHARQVSQDPLW